MKIPVVLLSATMRSEQRAAYLACYGAVPEKRREEAYPMITQVHETGTISETAFPAYTSSQYQFRTCGILEDIRKIAQMAVDKAAQGGCICVLMNTVRQAQAVYSEIQRIRRADCQTLLFHARYTVERRAEIERTCLAWFGKGDASRRPQRAILVATAVVEQSLDLDFDAMITQIAPMDLLLQRAGRVHRHHGRERPEALKEAMIDVLVPDGACRRQPLEHRYGLSGYVYDPYLLDNTERLIGTKRDIRVPEDIRPVVEEAYHGLTDENMAAFMKRQTESAFNEAEALSCCIPAPDPETFYLAETEDEWSVAEIDDGFEPRLRPSTRLGEPSVRVIFCEEALAQRTLAGELTREEAKAVFMKSVALPLKNLNRERDTRPREVQKGMLKGCVVGGSETLARIGAYKLTNDSELGVLMVKEDEKQEEV